MKQRKIFTTDQVYIMELTKDDILKAFCDIIKNSIPEEVRKEGSFSMWSPSNDRERKSDNILTLRWSKGTCDST